MKYRAPRTVAVIGLTTIVGMACQTPPSTTSADPVGSLSAALTSTEVPTDISGLDYRVVAASDTCDGIVLAKKTVALNPNSLPTDLAPAGTGDKHQFGDALFTLAPGMYRACVTPLGTDGAPSSRCHATSGVASVVAETTTEVLLVSMCDGDPNGALDTAVALNEPPVITDIEIAPSKFVLQCQPTTISITASDPDNDTLAFAWSIVSGPTGAQLAPTSVTAVFRSVSVGDYQLRVAVTDPFGASAALTFPIHVIAGGDLSPVDCQVSEWSDWSTCSAACGGGTQTRARTVVVASENGGAVCPSLSDSQSCNTEVCPPVCTNNCSGHGTCEVGNACTCDPDWTSADCSRPRVDVVFVLDTAGTLGSTDYSAIQNALATELGDPTVLPQDGSVSVGVVQYASNTQTTNVIEISSTGQAMTVAVTSTTTEVNVVALSSIGTSTVAGVTGKISVMGRYGNADSKGGVLSAISMLTSDGQPGIIKIIDVLTDEPPSSTFDGPCATSVVADDLKMDGISTHVLGLGTSWDETPFDCVVQNPTTDIVQVESTSAFAASLAARLHSDFQTN